MWISGIFACIIPSWSFSELGCPVGWSRSGISVFLSLQFNQGRIKYVGQGKVGRFQHRVTSGLWVADICLWDLHAVGIRSELLMLQSLAHFCQP